MCGLWYILRLPIEFGMLNLKKPNSAEDEKETEGKDVYERHLILVSIA